MRKGLLFLVCCLLFDFCSAQYIALPDTSFGKWLNTHGYSACLQGNSTTGWQMDTTCPAIVNEDSLDVLSSYITNPEGLGYFDNAEYLYLSAWSMQVVTAFPPNLKSLKVSQTSVHTLPSLPAGLTYLDCSINYLDSLPVLPSGLTYFDCAGNPLTQLPVLPNSIKYMDCRADTLLTALPALPDSLNHFVCYWNYNLNAMPAFPAGLKRLEFGGSPLVTVLPALPNGLTFLDLSYNTGLDSLPAVLPDSLTHLWCSRNYMNPAPFPPLPAGLQYLVCDGNNFTSIGNLPNSLRGLNAESNQLTQLGTMPDSMEMCYIAYNALTCLPVLKHIQSLYFSGNPVACVTNRGDVDYSTPRLDTIPLCNAANNPHDCQLASAVEEIEVSSFSLYPNPTASQLTINSSVPIEQINIYNTTGQLVSEFQVTGLKFEVDCSGFANGVYIAEIKTKDAAVMRRWMKM